MTSDQVRRSMLRLNREYYEVTENEKVINISDSFNIPNVCVYIDQIYDTERAFIVNQVIISIKRKKNNMNRLLLAKKLPIDVSNKLIDEYSEKYDTISFTINIDYDLLHYPFKPPVWNFVSTTVSEMTFPINAEHSIKYLIRSHNNLLQHNWSAAVTLRTDLHYFISKFIKFMEHL